VLFAGSRPPDALTWSVFRETYCSFDSCGIYCGIEIYCGSCGCRLFCGIEIYRGISCGVEIYRGVEIGMRAVISGGASPLITLETCFWNKSLAQLWVHLSGIHAGEKEFHPHH